MRRSILLPVIWLAACGGNSPAPDASVSVDGPAPTADAPSLGPDAHVTTVVPDAHVTTVVPDAHVTTVVPDAHLGTPDALPHLDATPAAPGTWTRLESGTTVTLYSIWGTPDGNNIWVGGEQGILYSSDHGDTWTPVYNVVGKYFYGLWGSAADDVYAVTGSGVHHWDGHAWSAQPVSLTYNGLYGIWGRGRDDVFGFDIDSQLDLQHSAGDGTWVGRLAADTETGVGGPHCTGIGFGDKVLYFAYESMIGRSGDDGLSWSTAFLEGDSESSYYAAIWGTSQFDLYVTGDGGYVGYSNDDGVSWNQLVTPTTNDLQAIWGSAPEDVYVVGTGVTILHTHDHGTTWTAEKNGTASETLQGVWGSSAAEVFAVGSGGLILRRTE